MTTSDDLSLPFPDNAPFRCLVSRDGDAGRVVTVGELDIATTPILEAEIEAIRSAGARRLTIDLSGLDFIDSTGLRCLLDCEAEARRDGFALSLAPGPDAVQRVFELTGTRTRLPFVDS